MKSSTFDMTPTEAASANNVVWHVAGSRAYGTNLPTSDYDKRGVFVASPLYVRTPFFNTEEVELPGGDNKTYELSKFIKLAAANNPNIIETLWIDDASILSMHSEAFGLLREAAPRMLTKNIANTTIGYAVAQLKRIKGHNKWINNPMAVEPPRMIDFVSLVQVLTGYEKEYTDLPGTWSNLKENPNGHICLSYGKNVFALYPSSRHSFYDQATGRLTDVSGVNRSDYGRPLYVLVFNEDEFKTQLSKHESYWTWKKNRNEARSELEEQHGYDTKHAMHCVRLLRMGVEAVETGKINVFRQDAAELLEIRNGAWTYEEIVEYAEQLQNDINVKVRTCDLPERADEKLLAKLVINIQDIMWNQ